MNETIIRNHNQRVKDEDLVFDLGDFIFRNSPGGKKGEGLTDKSEVFLSRLNGKRINVKGNHDRNNSLKTCVEKIYIKHGGKKICLVHNPIHADPNCELNFVGHVHTSWKIKRLSDGSIMVNVGVDVWNFRPITFEEIMKAVTNWRKCGEKTDEYSPEARDDKNKP